MPLARAIKIYALAILTCACSRSTLPEAPHIVVLIADDLGVKEAPCHSEKVRMPFLQSKCASSLVFTRAYTHPYCTSSRATLLTGRHPFRHGADDVRSHATKLPPSETTLAELIVASSVEDYQTAAFGKWHLADDQNGDLKNPNIQGFEYFEGTPRQHYTYHYFDYDWYINGKMVGRQSEYKTTKITDAVLSYFQIYAKEKPQFAVVSFTNPHLPYHVPPANLHSYGHLPENSLKRTLSEKPGPSQYRANRREPRLDPYYFAMLEALDSEIERLVKTLLHQANRPVIFIFLGDNGSAAEVYQSPNNDLIRSKATLYDGGVRVPLMIWSSHPQAFPINVYSSDRLIHLADLFPTIGELAGVPKLSITATQLEIDGDSFAEEIYTASQKEDSVRQFAFLERGNDERLPFAVGAVDNKGLKLILRETDRQTNYSQGVLIELYDTANDPHEYNNLADQRLCDVPSIRVNGLFEFITRKMAENTAHTDWFDANLYQTELERLVTICDNYFDR